MNDTNVKVEEFQQVMMRGLADLQLRQRKVW